MVAKPERLAACSVSRPALAAWVFTGGGSIAGGAIWVGGPAQRRSWHRLEDAILLYHGARTEVHHADRPILSEAKETRMGRPKAVLSRIRRAITPLKPVLERATEIECKIASAWNRSAHKRLMAIQWGMPPQPENFDHQIDQFYWWTATRNPQWVERGVFGALALKGGDVLELCCGDGFNARNFYSLKSRRVVACDFDRKIIRVAKRKNSAPNLSFVVADIRTQMPDGLYDNVVWDAAIEHFTELEIPAIMQNIKDRLAPGGILSGHTIAALTNQKQLSHHEYEFQNKEDLLRFFTPVFSNVLVFETEYPGRHNLHFWASEAAIPFGHGWTHAISSAAAASSTD
jgi:SAM-dependent methyltransferase